MVSDGTKSFAFGVLDCASGHLCPSLPESLPRAAARAALSLQAPQGTFPSWVMASKGCPEHQPSHTQGIAPFKSEPEKLEGPEETNKPQNWSRGQELKGVGAMFAGQSSVL